MLVYDLGGGTFDAPLSRWRKAANGAGSEGIANLGGDDFDQILAECAVGDEVGRLDGQRTIPARRRCRRHKEALHPNSHARPLISKACAKTSARRRSVADYYRDAARWSTNLAATRRPLRVREE